MIAVPQVNWHKNHERNHCRDDMVTQAPLSDEARSDLMSRCEGIRGLKDWLDGIDRRPGLDELDSRLSSLELNIAALEECIGYSDDGYQRNVISKNEHYELVAICWTPGQDTPIHDHVGSDCAFLIVSGVSTETIRSKRGRKSQSSVFKEIHAGRGVCC